MQRLRDFVRREVVLVVAVVLAAASCIAVPPDAAYSSYIDPRTLALLFCLMAVVAGLRSLGVLDSMGKWLVSRAKSQRAIAFALVGIAFFASMAVTNDVALITFVPLALVTLRAAGMEGRALLVAALMTVAANLGSMLTPVGNPQNLYLFTASGMSVSRFLLLMAPYTVLSAALLTGYIFVLFRSKPCCGEKAGKNEGCVRGAAGGGEVVPRSCWSDSAAPDSANEAREAAAPAPLWKCSCGRLTIYLALFCICLLAVAGIVDVRIVLAVVIVTVALTDAEQLRRVDFALLLTFVALFVFVGNMVRIPLVHDAVAGLVGQNAVIAAVGASQVVSNVPAAVLLSGFTSQWDALIVGTNLGGLGTLIASMASLITFKAISIGRVGAKMRYFKVFTLVNVVFLAVLLGFALLFGL